MVTVDIKVDGVLLGRVERRNDNTTITTFKDPLKGYDLAILQKVYSAVSLYPYAELRANETS